MCCNGVYRFKEMTASLKTKSQVWKAYAKGLVAGLKKLRLYLKGLYNKIDGLMIIKAFDVSCHPRKAPEIMEVVWVPFQDG